MTQKPRLIYNPAAGKGTAGENLPRVEALLAEHGFEYDLLLTQGPDHARTMAQQAAEAGCPLVVAAGGDGTVNETINGLMQANVNGNGRPALGVLPIGTGNDFAYGAGIPQEIKAAVESLLQGNLRRIDIGRVSGVTWDLAASPQDFFTGRLSSPHFL